MKSEIKTSPAEISGMPPGIPHIIGNEIAERFSFYGMKAVLAIFMVKYLHLMNATSGTAMSEAAATENVHLFTFAVYFTPFFGALLADIFWGKYRTIIVLSLVYVMGHAALAFMGVTGEAKWWLFAGLALIALGSGGIKPCVSAHVGDQFGSKNAGLLPKIFNWFYFSINLGAVVSMLLTPWLMEWFGPHWAFGVPGVLMALATLVFWIGRNRFVHVPAGGHRFVREITSREGWTTLLRIAPLYLFVAMFWALFDQTGTTWVFQAEDMDRQLFGVDWLPSQIQSLNSIFVLTFIPLFAYVLYPAISKIWPLTPLRKIGIGLFIMVLSFALVSHTQSTIDAGGRPNIIWQVFCYALLTAAEVMVAVVSLEFAYTQAPKTMKSLVMCFFLGSVAIGNLFTAGINHFIQIDAPVVTEKAPSPGFDGKIGTDDDISLVDDQLRFSHRPLIKQAIETIAAESDRIGNFPKSYNFSEKGLHYKVLNSRTVRISYDGPDGKPDTKWDVGAILTLPETVKKKKTSWTDALHPETPWLERRKAEIAHKEPKKKANAYAELFETEFYAGGGTKLEGASYFRFFTWLMLASAILFIPYAIFYKEKTHLQE